MGSRIVDVKSSTADFRDFCGFVSIAVINYLLNNDELEDIYNEITYQNARALLEQCNLNYRGRIAQMRAGMDMHESRNEVVWARLLQLCGAGRLPGRPEVTVFLGGVTEILATPESPKCLVSSPTFSARAPGFLVVLPTFLAILTIFFAIYFTTFSGEVAKNPASWTITTIIATSPIFFGALPIDVGEACPIFSVQYTHPYIL